MAKTLFTVAGANHYFGVDFLEPNQKLLLVKEPENEYDHEAIRIEVKDLGKIGYVANSPYTVAGETQSAGRLYDKIGDTAKAKVIYVLPGRAICKICKKSLLSYQPELPVEEANIPQSTLAE